MTCPCQAQAGANVVLMVLCGGTCLAYLWQILDTLLALACILLPDIHYYALGMSVVL